MSGERAYWLRLPAGELKLTVLSRPRSINEAERKLAQTAAFALRWGIETREPSTLALAETLGRLLEGGFSLSGMELFLTREPEVSRSFDAFCEELAARLGQALLAGRIVVERRVVEPLRERDFGPPPELAPLPPTRETSDTFFEVRFVDEIGSAISGLDVELDTDGTPHDVTTNAAGVALVENVFASSGTVKVADASALEKLLEPRWTTKRVGAPPREGNTMSIAFDGAPVGPLPIKAVVPNTIVLTPPLGRLFIELWDKTGRVRHANRDYTIDGPESFSGVTDERGRLAHDAVFPGDYTLNLTLEFFEGEAQERDEYTSPLVVLAANSSEPEVRLLGAVPFSVLARLHLFFNTNKTFLLPSALPQIRTLRQVYLANNPSKLLVVGHADTAGGPDFNDALSLERAEATIAFLKDDVDGWLKFYDAGIAKKKRWGAPEDRMMLLSLPDFRTKPKGEDAVRWFQQTRGLQVDGEAGPETRRQLISEYMALDGASLEASGLSIEATAHGCGENFPLDDTGEELDAAPQDEKRDPGDRRVELFFFDPEFGIVPAPPGKNSKPGSTQYPAWRKSAIAVHDLEPGELEGPKVTFIELIDAHFRSNSAVVLPEGENPTSDESNGEALSAVGVFAAALRYNDEHDGRRLFVAGHADTTASVDFNQKLSEERARVALALLVGGDAQRESFKTLCAGRHQVSDYKQILAWVSRAFTELDFDCDPGAIDDNEATAVEPVRRFQRAYNRNKAALGATGPELRDDGEVGPLTWGALFDCYEAALRAELGEDAAGLQALRDKLVFVDDARKALGFSEYFPIEELGVDNFKSEQNRRVEILFFERGEEPDLEHAEQDPETSELYLPGVYVRRPLRPHGALASGTFIGVRGTTRFSANSDFPKPSLLPVVRAMQQRLEEDPTLNVLLIGHADDVGNDQSVDALSLARAEATKAWLVGDSEALLSRFQDAGVAKTWSWTEIQWMLQALQLEQMPCYVDRVDGYPGPNTLRALEYFQVREELPLTGLADDRTLERLVQRYVELAERPVAAPRVLTVGAGKDHPPRAFGGEEVPVFPDEAPQRLRRVEGLLFREPLDPPETELTDKPRIYATWCRRVIESLDISQPLPTVIALVDEQGELVVSTSFNVLEADEGGELTSVASGSTNDQGVAQVLLPEGRFAIVAANAQGTIDVSQDEFGGQMLVVLSGSEA